MHCSHMLAASNIKIIFKKFKSAIFILKIQIKFLFETDMKMKSKSARKKEKEIILHRFIYRIFTFCV